MLAVDLRHLRQLLAHDRALAPRAAGGRDCNRSRQLPRRNQRYSDHRLSFREPPLSLYRASRALRNEPGRLLHQRRRASAHQFAWLWLGSARRGTVEDRPEASPTSALEITDVSKAAASLADHVARLERCEIAVRLGSMASAGPTVTCRRQFPSHLTAGALCHGGHGGNPELRSIVVTLGAEQLRRPARSAREWTVPSAQVRWSARAKPVGKGQRYAE